MELVVLLLTPLEMLLVNLFVIHKCSQHKYSRNRTLVCMGLFVCVLMYLSFLIARNAPDFGRGNGLFVFSGFLFILPVKLLYRTPGVRIVTIACFSWTYTFVLFVMSVRFAYALAIPGWSLSAAVLLLQTILYVVTIKAFCSILDGEFLFILNHIGKKENIAFMWMNMMWFWMVFVLNLSFAYPAIRLFQILSLLTLVLCILSSFRYIYLQVNSGKKIQTLEKIAYRDELTQLRSRAVLKSDAEDLIARKIPFHLIFFDLDNFKSVNDRYGHLVGDQYLAFFAQEIKMRTGNRGGFYRVAGDEFVCILMEDCLETFLEEIATIPKTIPNTQVQFLGFSYGCAYFPRDGDLIEKLLECADQCMYKMKRCRQIPSESEGTGTDQ